MNCTINVQIARVGALCVVLLGVMTGAALAQITGTVNPSAVPAETPDGGCKPIGLTASGEAVFPFQCKEFIERQKAANQKNAAEPRRTKPQKRSPSPPKGNPLPRKRSRQRCKKRPPPSNRTAWCRRAANRRVNSLVQFHCPSAPSARRGGAALGRLAARAFAPTIPHPAPTERTTDSAVSAERWCRPRRTQRSRHPASHSLLIRRRQPRRPRVALPLWTPVQRLRPSRILRRL